jgi:hypothetical protein
MTVVYMSVQESTIQKFFNNSLYHGYQRFAAQSRLHSSTRDFAVWIRNVVAIKRPQGIAYNQQNDTGLNVANREVHLEGYKTHEEVVRAYLEFAGIDPESKEGRLYFELKV